MDTTFDLVVIGGGPGGYVAALRSAQLGKKVAVVELRAGLGGVCLHEGCIPSKTLLDASERFLQAQEEFSAFGIEIDPPRLNLETMMARKQKVIDQLSGGIAALFKKHKVTWVRARGALAGTADGAHRIALSEGDDGTPAELQAAQVLLATGSRAVELPNLPFSDERIVHARGALTFAQVPEHLLVVGGGAIGLELGSVWRRLGAQVTVVEMLPQLLPSMDGQLAKGLLKLLGAQGLEIHLDTRITAVETDGDRIAVTLQGPDGEQTVDCDRILVAAGRKPWTEGLGLEEAGVKVDERGRVQVDADYQTSAAGIYAIGDLIVGPMLAHKAMEDAVAFAERQAGQPARVDYNLVPGVVYTWPEGASVGQTEEQLKEAGTPYKAGTCPFAANGRAHAMGATDGFVKLLAHADTGRLLGAHVLGPHASALIAEAATVMNFGGSVQDIILSVHAHPTLSEVIKEAALAVEKRALHA